MPPVSMEVMLKKAAKGKYASIELSLIWKNSVCKLAKTSM